MLRPTRGRRQGQVLNLHELQEETNKLASYLNREWEFVVRQVSAEKLLKLLKLLNISRHLL
jgi:uncharacterized protein (DUF2164 family)